MKLVHDISKIPSRHKLVAVFILDAFISVMILVFLCLTSTGPSIFFELLALSYVPMLYFLGYHKRSIRHFRDNIKYVLVLTLAYVSVPVLLFVSGFEEYTSLLLIKYAIATMAFIVAYRLLYIRLTKYGEYHIKHSSKPVVLVGVNQNALAIKSTLLRMHSNSQIMIVDDDPGMIGRYIGNVQVHPISKIYDLCEKEKVETIVISNHSYVERIGVDQISFLKRSGVSIKIINNVVDTILCDGESPRLTNICINDILGRMPVEPDQNWLKHPIESKVVLVTGAGGSIGQELTRIIYFLNPKKLIILDHSEFNLYQISEELKKLKRTNAHINFPELIPVLASVLDQSLIENLFKTHRPNTVFHAAAYKHVPLVEQNIISGIYNNVYGTMIIVDASKKYEVDSFVLISTDKAVRPTNVMGTTKRIAELIALATDDSFTMTKCTAVRFGNVLGSSGSVIPLFESQMANMEPLTVTHKDITRYFMTIKEAAQLVVQSIGLSNDKDIVLLDMGEPLRIYDLALKMIELSGLKLKSPATPDGDIEINITGLRPGEKLYEELLITNDCMQTLHPKIMRSKEPLMNKDQLYTALNQLRSMLIDGDLNQITKLLKEIVPEYTRNMESAHEYV